MTPFSVSSIVVRLVGASCVVFATLGCGSDTPVGGATAPSDAGDAAPVAVTCAANQTCTAGRCVVTVPASEPFSTGAVVTVAETSLRRDLESDAITAYACTVTVPDGLTGTAVALSMTLDKEGPDAILFRDDGDGATAVAGSTTSKLSVAGLLQRTGAYAATLRPVAWSVGAAIPNDPLSSADPRALARNLTQQPMFASFYDGTHLFVGSGPRVLAYEGIPAGPDVKPAFVLGQPDLDHIVSGVSGANFAGTVRAVWSNGSKLAVAESNRVLIWNAIPSASYTPADIVLGQQSFSTNGGNVGGVSAATLLSPRGITSDGNRFIVADTLNMRVLAWSSFPVSIGEPANSVLGQDSFSSTIVGNLYQPMGAVLSGNGAFVASAFTGTPHFSSLSTNTLPDFYAIDPSYPLKVQRTADQGATSIATLPSGGLALTTQLAPRIGIQRASPSAQTPYDFVLGQPDPDRAVWNPVSGSSVTINAHVSSSNGVTLVADTSRTLVYTHEPAFEFDPADRVIGQFGFSVNDDAADYRRVSERTLGYPSDVATNGSVIAVADRGNNRVLLYPISAAGVTNAAATVVLGQPDAGSAIANVDLTSASASTLSGPSGVAIDANRLIVADTENHRVLVWSPVPSNSATPATYVLGQGDFAGHRPNAGRGDSDRNGYSDAAADGMFYPTGVATDGTRLFVADRVNHRVLVWRDLASIRNGKAADSLIGQASFGDVLANRGNGLFPVADGFSLPTGVAIDGTSLYVADTENNRVVRWDNAASTPTFGAVIGQANGTSLANPNTDPTGNPGRPVTPNTTSTSVLRPRSVAVRGGRVLVSERDSNRVHVFSRSGNNYSVEGLLGQVDPTSATANAGGVNAGSLSAPEGLATLGDTVLVADASNHRVVTLNVLAVSLSGVAATSVLGQSTFVSNGMNQVVASTAGGAVRPSGLSISDNELWVAERGRHRVLVHELPLIAGRAPKRIIGQPGLDVILPNAGGLPGPGTLAGPAGVFVDEQHALIADTANHRVLVFARNDAVPSIVLGQATFTDVLANRGDVPNAGTLSAPEGVYTDGKRLVVADSGNHRVLVWTSFPTTNGAPADLVIGQPTFSVGFPNLGVGVASPLSLASPTAVLLQRDRLFVADSGNNRVVGFDSLAAGLDVRASVVIGQQDFGGRAPETNVTDGTKLGGPVALGADGATLYVSDRDANRIAAFALASIANGASASQLYNANNGLVTSGPAGLAVERTPFFGSRVYLSDTNRDQLLVLENLSRLR